MLAKRSPDDDRPARWIFPLKVTVTLAIIVGFVYAFGDELEMLPQVLARTPATAVLAALALSVIGTVILPAVATQRTIVGARIALSLWELVKINFITRFYSLVLPRGGAFGVRWHRYSKAGTGRDALALVLFERLVGMLVMTLAAVVFLAFDQEVLPAAGTYIWVASIVLLAAVGLLLLPFLSPACARLLERALSRSLPFASSLRRPLGRLWEAVHAYHALTRRTVFAIVWLNVAGYALFVASPYALTLGMGIDISLWALAWMRSLTFILTLIPATIAGIGVRELALVGFFELYGTSKAEAVALALLLLGIQLVIGLYGAILEAWQAYVAPVLTERRHAGRADAPGAPEAAPDAKSRRQ